ncbi:hypothetical protein DUI87_10780 [Hirundo rustica rustica]|uniref:Uncharacterized protein n=1 Tax=Hirundo rustica rustica TaxID=333673 RepID=A0A3M0KJK8_HIRRU|nr:hypothetical protein DUI87_10780 [Hirundo rustica rustica]
MPPQAERWPDQYMLTLHLWSLTHILVLTMLAHKIQKALTILAEIFIFLATFKALHKVLVYLVQNYHLEMGKVKCPACRTPSRFANDLKLIGYCHNVPHTWQALTTG